MATDQFDEMFAKLARRAKDEIDKIVRNTGASQVDCAVKVQMTDPKQTSTTTSTMTIELKMTPVKK